MRKATRHLVDNIDKIEMPEHVTKIILYGSEVYGKPKLKSDVDVAVISDIKINVIDKIKIEDELEKLCGLFDIQVVYISSAKYKKGFDVKRDIFERGLVIYERK